MRPLLFVLAFVVAACGDDGHDVRLPPIQHEPEISNLSLSPDNALYMQAGGSIEVTAELAFTDPGGDVETLHVGISDGTGFAFPVTESAGTVSGTLTAEFNISTADANGCTVEIWLVDKAGQSSNHLFAAFSVLDHAPEISNLNLSPASAVYMEGGGRVVVSAEISFRDIARDLQALWVQTPDGTAVEFDEFMATETGTFTKQFTMSTEAIGAFTVEFWLVDMTGQASAHRAVDFSVSFGAQSSNWTNRLSGLPYKLNDVIWDGSAFIAVGDKGAILTSADGIDWMARDSTTDTSLGAVTAYGRDVFAVGYEIVLHSTDHGETWVVKHQPAYAGLRAVAVNSSRVVVCGNVPDLFLPRVMISEDRGDTWQEVSFPWAYFFGFFNDLIYRDGLFVAVTDALGSDGRVMVSSDGAAWTEVFHDEEAGLIAIVHDGSQFVASGGNGAVFRSFDGFSWTKLQLPVADADYLSAAWSGSKLMLAGGYSWRYYSRLVSPPVEVPIGAVSTDGGDSWDIFNIDGNYESNGMAFGNGRFVSVGQTAPASDEGAIYTTE